MRRPIAYTLLFVILSALISVHSIQADIESEDKPLIVVTISPLYLIAKEVIGSKAEMYVLAQAGVDPHSYSPTPKDVMLVSSCDLFICVGQEEFLGQLPKPEHGLVISWDSWINKGAYIKDDNPHYLWLYPPNAKVLAKAIAETMSTLDPDHSNYYITRADNFAHEVDNLNTWLEEVMKDVDKGHVNIVLAGDHFEPLIEWMGLNISYVIVKGHGGLPGPQRIKEAIIAAKSSSLIIASATQSESYEGLYAQQVSAGSGTPIAYLYGIPISMSDSYIDFIKYNVMIIASHLRHSSPMRTLASSEEVYTALTILFASIAAFEGIIILRLRAK